MTKEQALTEIKRLAFKKGLYATPIRKSRMKMTTTVKVFTISGRDIDNVSYLFNIVLGKDPTSCSTEKFKDEVRVKWASTFYDSVDVLEKLTGVKITIID